MKSKFQSQLPTTGPQVQVFNLSDALAKFRAQLERDAGEPACNITTSVAILLDDLCAFLGFGPEKRAKIIGSESDAAALVEAFLDAHAPRDTVTVTEGR